MVFSKDRIYPQFKRYRSYVMKILSTSLIFMLTITWTPARGQKACPPHPTPPNGYSVCSNGQNRRSLCETKCNNGFRVKGSSHMLCWCGGDQCSWTGPKAICEKTGCEFPDVDTGSLRFVDTWKGGFAGLIEFENVHPNQDAFGWSVVLIFERPLGLRTSLISWNLEISATSFDRQTFTFTNPEIRQDLSKMISPTKRFSVLIVANNIEGKVPQSAFAGLYYKPIKDATCLMAPSMPIIRPLYGSGISTDVVKLPETPRILVTTPSSGNQIVPHGGNKTSKPKSHPTVETVITTVSPSTTTPNDVPKTGDEVFCKGQTHEDSYVADKRWEDQGKHHFNGHFNLQYPEELPDWRMVVAFDEEIKNLQTWACEVLESSEDGRIWTFGPHSWNTKLTKGKTKINFLATQAYATVKPPSGQVFLCSETFTDGAATIKGTGLGAEVTSDILPTPIQPISMTTRVMEAGLKCSERDPSGRPVERAGQTEPEFKPNTDDTKYNYNEVLHKSLLFYEAQRTGRLPYANRIPWRGDSALKDGCDVNIDLTGGWYDAGDGVKFNFPMAYTLTTLAWGGIEFRQAYEDAGELNYMTNTIKWATEYFIKTHISNESLAAQVGHGQTDHNYWGRPEEMKMNRPTYILTTKKPGSDLAAEVAAALAASSIFLRKSHPRLSEEALTHSKGIFEFADRFRAKYSDSIPDAASYYKSYSGFQDELTWGATWLFKATQDAKYLERAEMLYENIKRKTLVAHEFSWDDKIAGAQVLLADITKKEKYRKPFMQFLNSLPQKRKTPQGLYYIGDWGSNRYAANAAFMLIMGARLQPRLPKRAQYMQWAKKQIGLLLGDAGRSYVIGFGENPPLRAHHAASSCPPYPERCDWSTYHSSKPNHYVLYGGLVGGPNQKGIYNDVRSNYQESEVACDYNAGFQSAVAGLKHFAMQMRTVSVNSTATPSAVKRTTRNVTSLKSANSTRANVTESSSVASTRIIVTQNSTSEYYQANSETKETSPTKTIKNAKKCRPKRSKKCIQARRAAKKAAAKKRSNNGKQNS